MLLSVSSFAWIFVISLILFFLAKQFRDETIGICSGLLLFLLGVYTLINNISGVEVWMSVILGSVAFGIGGYVWVITTIEVIDK